MKMTSGQPPKLLRMAISHVDFYFEDFLVGVRKMTLDQVGAYMILLCLYWAENGVLEDDDRLLAMRCNCSIRKWRTLRGELIAMGKIEVSDGKLSNHRAEIARINALKIKRDAHDKGVIGGRRNAEKWAEKTGKAFKYNDDEYGWANGTGNDTAEAEPEAQPMPQGEAPSSSSTSTKKNLTSPPPSPSSARARDPKVDGGGPRPAKPEDPAEQVARTFLAIRDELWPTHPALSAPTMTLESEVRGWLAQGMMADVLVGCLRTQMAKTAADGLTPPTSLKAYRNSIQDAHAKTSRPGAAGPPIARAPDGKPQATAREPWIRPWMDAEMIQRRREYLTKLNSPGSEEQTITRWAQEDDAMEAVRAAKTQGEGAAA